MDKALVFSSALCTGCGLCELICSLVHTGTCSPARSRIRILRMEQKGVIAQTFCQQCEDAACIAACPVSAIRKNESAGVIEIDHGLCIMCDACIAACPFDGIYRDETDEQIIACDLCGAEPQCVKYCETKAIEFVDKDPAAAEKKKDSLRRLEGLLKIGRSYMEGTDSSG